MRAVQSQVCFPQSDRGLCGNQIEGRDAYDGMEYALAESLLNFVLFIVKAAYIRDSFCF